MKLRDELDITIIIVTHDLGLAWTVADRVAVMYLGRIVEIGPAEEVLLRPLHPYTKALLDVVPEAGGIDRPILTGEPPDPTRIPRGAGSTRGARSWRRARRPSSGIEPRAGRGPGARGDRPGALRRVPRSRQLGAEAHATIAAVDAAVAPEPIAGVTGIGDGRRRGRRARA